MSQYEQYPGAMAAMNYGVDPNQDPRLYDQAQQQAAAAQPGAVQSWFNVNDTSYLKGAVVGAAVALLAANPTVQKAIVSASVKVWTAMRGGMEELKEHVQDIKAEISSKE